MDAGREPIRDQFLRWQCGLRRHAMRETGGRPSSGTCPEVFIENRPLGRIVTLIVHRQMQFLTARFRHMVKSTFDPRKRYENAVRFLAGEYYDNASNFSDQLAASFGAEAKFAESLTQSDRCRLEFSEGESRYTLTCGIRRLGEKSPIRQMVYWHNQLFNPNIPPDLQVLAFSPDWTRSRAGKEQGVTASFSPKATRR